MSPMTADNFDGIDIPVAHRDFHVSFGRKS
jgi:hypothetical protein